MLKTISIINLAVCIFNICIASWQWFFKGDIKGFIVNMMYAVVSALIAIYLGTMIDK